jgi:hypothetical protein
VTLLVHLAKFCGNDSLHKEEEEAMINQAYQHSVVIFLFGIATGLLLAISIGQSCGLLRTEASDHRRRQKETERGDSGKHSLRSIRRAIPEEIPEIEDDRMLCVLCWEERHPGLHWPFGRYLGKYTFCTEHRTKIGSLNQPGLQQSVLQTAEV